MVNDAVTAATSSGIPVSAIVPVYQAFGGGGYTSWTLPTVSQAQQDLATWAPLTPNPPFDYVYAWGSQNGDTALSESPELEAVFAQHDLGACVGSE